MWEDATDWTIKHRHVYKWSRVANDTTVFTHPLSQGSEVEECSVLQFCFPQTQRQSAKHLPRYIAGAQFPILLLLFLAVLQGKGHNMAQQV